MTPKSYVRVTEAENKKIIASFWEQKEVLSSLCDLAEIAGLYRYEMKLSASREVGAERGFLPGLCFRLQPAELGL